LERLYGGLRASCGGIPDRTASDTRRPPGRDGARNAGEGSHSPRGAARTGDFARWATEPALWSAGTFAGPMRQIEGLRSKTSSKSDPVARRRAIIHNQSVHMDRKRIIFGFTRTSRAPADGQKLRFPRLSKFTPQQPGVGHGTGPRISYGRAQAGRIRQVVEAIKLQSTSPGCERWRSRRSRWIRHPT
jgi:hypothetical protein